uniref:Uncharacterized protein n=1 Tax=Spermophilus dauricus TaxID=99837 RepID=A0A8C9P6I0_SPEDA
MVLYVGDCVPNSNMPSLSFFSVTILIEVELILGNLLSSNFFLSFLFFFFFFFFFGLRLKGMVLSFSTGCIPKFMPLILPMK